MSISKKVLIAGMFAFAMTMGTQAIAADTLIIPNRATVVVPDYEDVGDNSIALWDAEEELEHMGLNPDNFGFEGMTGREISEEMYPIEESQGD